MNSASIFHLLVSLFTVFSLSAQQTHTSIPEAEIQSLQYFLGQKTNGIVALEIPISPGEVQPYLIEQRLRDSRESIYTYHGYHRDKPNDWISIVTNPSHILMVRYGKSHYETLEKAKSGYQWLRHEMGAQKAHCFTTGKSTPQPTKKNLVNKDENPDLLTYRIAVSATPEFSALHGSTTEEVNLAIIGYLNQVNNIFERELGLRLILVPDNDKLIFLDADNDPFPDQLQAAIVKNANIIHDSLGVENYDIGHLLSLGGGGIANIRVACTDRKASGASGFEEVSSFFKLLAHEIGHQIGAGHTWNSCTSGLNSTQRSPSGAMEPGSGTSIMSYAGLCGANNIDLQPDPYFHIVSIEQVAEFTRNAEGSSCAQLINIPNTPPQILSIDVTDKKIPISTPFMLTGKAQDAEDEALSYTWDQVDQGPIADLGTVEEFNPIFRSEVPSASPTRFFPDLVTIANKIDDPAQLLPSFDRSLEFKFVVRDNHSGNGNTSSEFLELEFDETAGPFFIKPESTLNDWYANGTHPVLWDIANTTNPEVNCQRVDVLIDYDGSLEFKDTLIASTPNDGLHYVQLPDTVSTQARIMVKASDNIFFDITEEEFQIIRPTEKDFLVFTDTTSFKICALEKLQVNIKSSNINFFNNLIHFSPVDLPPGINISFSDNNILAGANTFMNISFEDDINRTTHEIRIQAFAPNGTLQFLNFRLDIIPNELSPAELLYPAQGDQFDTDLIAFNWIAESANYELEISSGPNFIPENKVAAIQTINENTESVLPYNQAYFWRINSANNCSADTISEVGFFGLKDQTCFSRISNSAIATIPELPDSVSKTIEFTEDLIINEIKVSNIRGEHTFVGDLDFVLIAPDGSRFSLLEKKCAEAHDFNISFSQKGNRFRCPLNQNNLFVPESDLNQLRGTSSLGTWTLKIIDEVPGDGGTLESWTLEICALNNLYSPEATVQDTLKLRPASAANILQNTLEFQDQDNTPSEVKFTLLTLPSKGWVQRNNEILTKGQSFSQADINDGLIEYWHSNSIEETDEFTYVVTDGRGSISSAQKQPIVLQNNVSVRSPSETFGIKIFPNPTSDKLTIQSDQNLHKDLKILMFGLDGKQLLETVLSEGNDILEIPITEIRPGLYILKITSNDSSAFSKITILR